MNLDSLGAYRRDYCGRLADGSAEASPPEILSRTTELTAAAPVGAVAEARVGPLSPVAGDTAPQEEIVTSLLAFCRRAVGAPARA